MENESWFETPVFWGIASDVDTTPIEQYIREEMSRDKEGNHLSNIGGWQSQNQYLNNMSCRELRGLLAAAEQWMNDHLPLKRPLAITNIWYNVNQGGTYNIKHLHPDSIFSGVFYVKGGETQDTGMIHFHRNQFDSYILASYFETGIGGFTDTMVSHLPVTKKLILFPSWIEHEVECNKTNEDRISVAFNTAFAN